MDFFTVLMLAASAYSVYASSQSDKGRPSTPSLLPPDSQPIKEQTQYTGWQNDERNKLLAEYYGGTLSQSNPNPDPQTLVKPTYPITQKEVGGISKIVYDPTNYYGVDPHQYDTGLSPRVNVSFSGTTPSQNWTGKQNKILNDSQSDFASDLDKYYKDRGLEGSSAVKGASQELSKDYAQKAREINSKSHDIYALTLGNLMGEVSDAGAQTTRLTGSIGQAGQMENARRNASYQQAMQKWQYDQSQPTTMGSIGSLLPYLAMAFGGSSGGAGSTLV